MEKIKFEEYKQKIIDALNRKGNLGISEPVSLIEGFANQSLQAELSGSLTLGGPTIPMVMLLGSNTGRVYFFALRAILPEIKL